ncbi:uncharacterized [Tachysurus ichikawai]
MSGLVMQTEEIRDQVGVVRLTEKGGPGEEDCDEELIQAEDSFVMGVKTNKFKLRSQHHLSHVMIQQQLRDILDLREKLGSLPLAPTFTPFTWNFQKFKELKE